MPRDLQLHLQLVERGVKGHFRSWHELPKSERYTERSMLKTCCSRGRFGIESDNKFVQIIEYHLLRKQEIHRTIWVWQQLYFGNRSAQWLRSWLPKLLGTESWRRRVRPIIQTWSNGDIRKIPLFFQFSGMSLFGARKNDFTEWLTSVISSPHMQPHFEVVGGVALSQTIRSARRH